MMAIAWPVRLHATHVATRNAPRCICRMFSQRCSITVARAQPNNGGDGAEEKQQLLLEQLAKELIEADPEAMQRIERVTAAAQRVAELQAEQARLAAAMAEEASDEAAEVQERRQVLAASSTVAEAEVRAAELLLQAAQLEAEQAESLKRKWAAEDAQQADRVESGKAGAAAGIGGALGTLPYLLASATNPLQGLLELGGAAASAVLFGVTYRYAVRTDIGNTQLKAGVVAAFGLVRGLAQASEILAPSSSASSPGGNTLAALLPSVDALGQAALAAGQSMLVFAFASAALEFAFRQGYVQLLGTGGTGSGQPGGE